MRWSRWYAPGSPESWRSRRPWRLNLRKSRRKIWQSSAASRRFTEWHLSSGPRDAVGDRLQRAGGVTDGRKQLAHLGGQLGDAPAGRRGQGRVVAVVAVVGVLEGDPQRHAEARETRLHGRGRAGGDGAELRGRREERSRLSLVEHLESFDGRGPRTRDVARLPGQELGDARPPGEHRHGVAGTRAQAGERAERGREE